MSALLAGVPVIRLWPAPAPSDPDWLHDPLAVQQAHLQVRPLLLRAARVVAADRTVQTFSVWSPSDVVLPQRVRPDRQQLILPEAETVLYLCGHAPDQFRALLNVWADGRRDRWAKGTNAQVRDFLALEATCVDWFAVQNCYRDKGMSREDILTFTTTFGADAFHACWRAGLAGEEFAAIIAAGGFEPVGGWEAVQVLAALRGNDGINTHGVSG